MKEVPFMLYVVLEIILCFFAIVGIVCTVFEFFDLYTAKKSGLALDVHIKNAENIPNPEYSVRVLESMLNHSALYGITQNIIIPKQFFADDILFEKLALQYKNIRKEE